MSWQPRSTVPRGRALGVCQVALRTAARGPLQGRETREGGWGATPARTHPKLNHCKRTKSKEEQRTVARDNRAKFRRECLDVQLPTCPQSPRDVPPGSLRNAAADVGSRTPERWPLRSSSTAGKWSHFTLLIFDNTNIGRCSIINDLENGNPKPLRRPRAKKLD